MKLELRILSMLDNLMQDVPAHSKRLSEVFNTIESKFRDDAPLDKEDLLLSYWAISEAEIIESETCVRLAKELLDDISELIDCMA